MKLFASVILGIVIALFVGVGINLFYPEPSYPTELMSFTNSEPTEAEAEASNLAYIEFEKERQLHSGIVGVISIVLSVLLMAGSMFLAKKNEVVSQGLLVGGLLLICYGATQAISSGNMMAAFISIGVGLAALIVFILKRFRSVNGETVQS
ncbi:MAG: hypothetical protein RL720_248 [Actinomycetota bacterium]